MDKNEIAFLLTMELIKERTVVFPNQRENEPREEARSRILNQTIETYNTIYDGIKAKDD